MFNSKIVALAIFGLGLVLSFLTVSAQSLPEQYAQLSAEQRFQYDVLTQKLKPKLEPLEASLIKLAQDRNQSASQRVQALQGIETRLETWVSGSLTKYILMQSLRSTLDAQLEALLKQMPIRTPYHDTQIKTQFNVAAAQPYAYGARNLPLVRGDFVRGALKSGDTVMIYFKQGGPVRTSILEDVTNPGANQFAFLLADPIESNRFRGNAVLLVPGVPE